MDRVIALVAALVALVSLAATVMVATNGDLERRKLATEIAQLKTGMTLSNQLTLGAMTQSATPAGAPDAKASTTIAALEARIATLEEKAASQSIAQASAPSVPADASSAPAAPTDSGVAMLSPSSLPSQSASPAALDSAGPTADCIPLGTRFMAKAGDDFPICKTKIVVKVAGVGDSEVVLQGAGSIATGAFAPLGTPGCQAMVMSSDVATGYAELRITCQ